MASVWMTFRECGFAAWGILLASLFASGFGLLAAVLSLARVRLAKVLAGVAFVLALSPMAFGAFGMFYGRSIVDAAVSGELVDETQRVRIRTVGYREAGGCVPLGVGFSALPLLLAGAAVVIALSFPKKPEVSADV